MNKVGARAERTAELDCIPPIMWNQWQHKFQQRNKKEKNRKQLCQTINIAHLYPVVNNKYNNLKTNYCSREMKKKKLFEPHVKFGRHQNLFKLM